ncbi:uncharacterized protein [Diadema antillarum]|uniref:uncharacterized protein n=1 Tax=Diadema antillarum TaxID=105358 RepID=UPI003A848525
MSEADNKLCVVVLLVCCVFIIATAGLVLGALSLAQIGLNGSGGAAAEYHIYAQTSDGSGGSVSATGMPSSLLSPSPRINSDDDVWLFAIGDYDNNVEYLDPESYQVKGYNADIVDAVCDIANKNCELVWDVYGNCWDTTVGERGRGGVGLMARYYTACTGWVQTYERLLTFDFTRPFSQKSQVALYAKIGSSQSYADLSAARVGFLGTWFSDATCLARYVSDTTFPIAGAELPDDRQTVFSSADDLIVALNTNQIDVVFSPKLPQLDGSLQRISPDDFTNNCEAAGGSMMTSKANKEFTRWWDDAFARLITTSRYDTICQNILREHGDIAGNAPEDICIGY